MGAKARPRAVEGASKLRRRPLSSREVTFLPQDQLWQVPLAPPEDILSWLSRIGLLQTDEPEDGDQAPRGDSLLEDEFDLDEDGDAVLGVSEPEGAMMSDDVMS